MFVVYIKNGSEEQVIHVDNPDVRSPKLLTPVITNEINAISTFSFTLIEQEIKLFEHLSMVRVWSQFEQKNIFEGRVFQIIENMNSEGKIVRNVLCEGELAYLLDTRVRKFDFKDETVESMLNFFIENHNANADPHKQFKLGRVEFTERLYRSSEIFETTLKIIQDRLISALGGELLVTKENGQLTLHYVKQSGVIIPSPIRLGQNMIEMELIKDLSGACTRLIPTSRGEKGEVITIESVNGGKIYIEDEEAVKNYGIIETSEVFENITSPVTLLNKGKERLKELIKITRMLKLNALDLSILDRDIHSFNVGDDVPIINPLMGVDENFRIVKKTLDLYQPWKSTIEIANKYDSLTSKQVGMNSVANKVNNVMDGEKVSTNYLQGSIDLMKNAMFATGEFQNAEVIDGKGILLENNMVESNGYGAMYLGPTGFSIAPRKVNGQWDWRSFGTGQGFVADFITTGTLNAEIVNVINLKGENIDAKRLTVTNEQGVKTLAIDEKGNVSINAAEINIAVGGNTNLTSKEELEGAIKDAKDEINNQIGEVQKGLGSLGEYVDGAFKDGIISETEKQVIAEHLRELDKEKLDVDKQVDEILKTELISESGNNLLISISNTKIEYDLAHTELVDIINEIITSNNIDVEDLEIMDSLFQNYATKLSDLNVLMQQIIPIIADEKVEQAKVEIKVTTDTISSTVSNLEKVVEAKPSKEEVVDLIQNMNLETLMITITSTNGDIFKQERGITYLTAKIISGGKELDVIDLIKTVPSTTQGYVEGSIIYTTSDDKYRKNIGGSWVLLNEAPSYENGHSEYKYVWFKEDASFSPYSEPEVYHRGKILKVESSDVVEISNFKVEVMNQE